MPVYFSKNDLRDYVKLKLTKRLRLERFFLERFYFKNIFLLLVTGWVLVASPSWVQAQKPTSAGCRVLVIYGGAVGTWDDEIASTGYGSVVNFLTNAGNYGTGNQIGDGYNFTVDQVDVPANWNSGDTYANAVGVTQLAPLPITPQNYCMVFDLRFNPCNFVAPCGPAAGSEAVSWDTITQADVTTYDAYVSQGGGLFIMGDNYWDPTANAGAGAADGFVTREETMYLLVNSFASAPVSQDAFQVEDQPSDLGQSTGANSINTNYNNLASYGSSAVSFSYPGPLVSPGSGVPFAVGSYPNDNVGVAWSGAGLQANYKGSVVYWGDTNNMQDWATTSSTNNLDMTYFMDNIVAFLDHGTCCNMPTPTHTLTPGVTFTFTVTPTPSATFTITPTPTVTSTPNPASPPVVVALGPAPPPNSTQLPGASNVPVEQLKITNNSSESVTLSSVTFTASGTGNSLTGLVSVQLYLDATGNGIVGPGDTLLATGIYAANGTITFNGSPLGTLAAGTAKNYLVVYNFSATAPNGTYSTSLAANANLQGGGQSSNLPIQVSGAPVNGAVITINANTPTVTGTPTSTPTITPTPPPSVDIFYVARNSFIASEGVSINVQYSQFPGNYDLKIYNTAGEFIKSLDTDYITQPVNRNYTWDGTNKYGNHCASGVYILYLIEPFDRKLKRVILIK
jgi:hypothetical protein